jgi:hypothetical protein
MRHFQTGKLERSDAKDFEIDASQSSCPRESPPVSHISEQVNLNAHGCRISSLWLKTTFRRLKNFSSNKAERDSSASKVIGPVYYWMNLQHRKTADRL